MCYRLTERYSVCKCVYYQHQTYSCAASGTEGHVVETKTILVGYLCTEHSSALASPRPRTSDKTNPQRILTAPQGVKITSDAALNALEGAQLMEDGNTSTDITEKSAVETTSTQSTVDSEPSDETKLQVDETKLQVDETKLQGELDHSYNLEDLRSRLLYPSQYIMSLQELENKVYNNAIISRTQHHFGMPCIQYPIVPSELEHVIPSRLSHDPFAKDPTNTSDDEITMVCASAADLAGSRELNDIRVCRNVTVKTFLNLKLLQQSNFCAGSFSILVLDRRRQNVATLVPIESTDFMALVYELECILRNATSLVLNASGSETPLNINTRWEFLNTPSVKQYCQSILQINPGDLQDSTLGVVSALLALVLALDFAVVSYAGAHCSSNLGGPSRYDLMDIFEPLRGYFSRPMDSFIFRRCKLRCLDAFHSGKGVWVFCPPSCNPLSPLYISATINSFSDIWGPVWKLRDQHDLSKYTAYVVGNGSIIPWKHDERTSDKLEEERFCHWVSDEEQEDGTLDTRNLTFSPFDGTERLLIGAPTDAPVTTPPAPWIANPRCSIVVSEARRRLQEAKRLCIVGASRPYHYNDSNQYQLQVGYAGVNATIMRNYKRAAGQSLKEILIQLWALEPDLRDPRLLEDLHGVEISMCTSNAQRVSLTHLLRLQCMHHLLRDFPWEDPSYRDEYLLTLEDTRRPTRLRDARFKKKFDDAVMLGLKMLSKTGVDRSDNLRVFLSSPCTPRPELATMLPKEHSWIGMLKDTTTECALAAFGDTCLEFKHHKGISCGGVGQSALRSALILRSLYDRMFLKTRGVINLGERGELCLKSNLGGVPIMEWSNPYFKMALRSKFNKELVHREHTDIDHSVESNEVQTVTIFIVSSNRERSAW